MAGSHAPAVTLPDPLVHDPTPSGPRRHPMTRYPLMAIAHPSPISAQPHVTRYGRYTDYFLTRSRRGDHHDTARIVVLGGGYHTPGQCQTEEEAEG